MKTRLLTIAVAIASLFATQVGVGVASAKSTSSSKKKHHHKKNMKKTSGMKIATPGTHRS